MPEFVENQAAGVLRFLPFEGDGFPKRTMCLGDNWKRQGSGLEVWVGDVLLIDEDDFHGCGR